MGYTISREDTKVIKGAAILLMFMHHLWAFPDRITGGELLPLFQFLNWNYVYDIGVFGKICVSIFFFWGGYGTYLSCEKLSGSGKAILTKIKKLYLSYWKVFLIFIPVAFFLSSRFPIECENVGFCNRYSVFSKTEFFLNFLGLSSSYNGEWWFLQSYICALITFPLIRQIIGRHSLAVNTGGVIICHIFITNILPAIGNNAAIGNLNSNILYALLLRQAGYYTVSFWSGCILAKDSTLLRAASWMREERLLNPISDICIMAAVIFMRLKYTDTLDFIYVPFFSLAILDILGHSRPLRWFFLQMGKESTNMWLIHSFLCYYFNPTAKWIGASHLGSIAFIELAILSYISSIAVEKLWGLFASIWLLLQKQTTCSNR